MEQDHKQKLVRFLDREKRMPTYSEMLSLFGFKSKNAVSRLVDKLVDAGLVAKDSLGRLLPMPALTEVPMLGLVTYILEVDGNSMIDAHIADGDMVIAERTETARDGDIVIAEVDGEFTMKYFRKDGAKVWLEPANKDFKPIYPTTGLKVCAVVKGVVRKY